MPNSIQRIRQVSTTKKRSTNPPSAHATVRCCSGFGLVMPKAPTKLSTRKFSNLIISVVKYRSPRGVVGSKIAEVAEATVVREREEVPDPAREALDEPHLDAEELE